MALSRSTSWQWVVALVLIAGGSAPSRAGFTITNLGVINPSGTSGATGINAGGVTSGMVTEPSLPGSGMIAASSANGTLQPVNLPPGTTSSIANAINASGTVAGNFTTSSVSQEGFYTPATGAAVPIGFLTLNGVAGTNSVANGINDGGEVVGTGNLSTGVQHRAFVDMGGTLTMIAPLGSTNAATSQLSNWANGINSGGTVVGSSEVAVGGLVSAFYTDAKGNPVDLITQTNAGNFQANTYGTAIDTYGDIVGYGNVGGNFNAFFAPDGGGPLVDLGTLGNALSSQALALNDNGLVVGTSGGRAFLWSSSTGMVDLNTLIPAADRSNWVLTEATGINDNGQISGEGLFDGVLQGFLLTPVPGQVPTPPALLLSAVGFAMAGGWLRLKGGLGRRDPAYRD